VRCDFAIRDLKSLRGAEGEVVRKQMGEQRFVEEWE